MRIIIYISVATEYIRALRLHRVPLWLVFTIYLYYLLTESHIQPVWCFSFPFSTTGRPVDFLLEISLAA
jgi:hypothetical protein